MKKGGNAPENTTSITISTGDIFKQAEGKVVSFQFIINPG